MAIRAKDLSVWCRSCCRPRVRALVMVGGTEKECGVSSCGGPVAAQGELAGMSPDSGYEQLRLSHVPRVFFAECLEHHPFLCTDTKCEENSKRYQYDGPTTQFGTTSA